VYTTPSHQFPLGTPMTLERRTALLDWAGRHGAAIIEDDYDSEFRFADRPLDPLHSLDGEGRVIYVGSYSKTMQPMLRLGFLVAPASLRPALRGARQLSGWHGDLVTQAAMAAFIDEGLFARHVRKASKAYAARHALITSLLGLEIIPSAAGLHLCARIDEPFAAPPGVAVRLLSSFCVAHPARDGLVIGYGAIELDRIEAGIAALRNGFTARRV
jgi:GntR family transcriptional regulator/MocR family aminotransferase